MQKYLFLKTIIATQEHFIGTTIGDFLLAVGEFALPLLIIWFLVRYSRKSNNLPPSAPDDIWWGDFYGGDYYHNYDDDNDYN